MKIHTIIYSIAVILGVTACGHKTPKREMPKLHITVTEVYKKEEPTRMQFVGQTHSLNDVSIQARVSGYLLSSHYEPGMPVKQGQLLFKIDQNQLLVETTKAQAALASANSKLVEAENNYKRSVPLARMNAISQSSLDQATATLASAKANLLAAKASLRSANLNLSYTNIHAPIDGVIGVMNGSVGDYVGVGTDVPILNTISNIDSIYVYISIPTPKYLAIIERDSLNRPIYDNKGLLTDIDMILADDSSYPYKGVYQFTERAVNSETGAVVIQVLFPNPEGQLKPGQYVRVNANVGGGKGVVLVPQRSVMQSQGVNSVYIVTDDSTVHYRVVRLGATYGTGWGVLEGVQAGEMVVTEGLQKVRSQMKIVPIVESLQASQTK